jgi:hypothetical protein
VPLRQDSARALPDGRFTCYHLAAASYTIAAGTYPGAVQTIIAQPAVGLPRD